MPDWDEESPTLRKNLAQVTQETSRAAKRRGTPTLYWARRWHAMMMRGLEVPAPEYVGAFRGEPGVENIGVEIGGRRGVVSTEVAGELKRFESTLQALVASLDSAVPAGQELGADELAGVLDLCAWTHAEWVRIHPFVNGNGRTARIWANSLAKALRTAWIRAPAAASGRGLYPSRNKGDARRLEADRHAYSTNA